MDLFAGAGGATQGLVDAGFNVDAAVENDADAAASYRENHRGSRRPIRRAIVPAGTLLLDCRSVALEMGLVSCQLLGRDCKESDNILRFLGCELGLTEFVR